MKVRLHFFSRLTLVLLSVSGWEGNALATDHLRQLQTAAVEEGRSDVGHWGPDPENYTMWGSHTNRLIPVYTYGTQGGGPGVDLTSYQGANSPYRDREKIRRLYGRVPSNTLNLRAQYFDQTNIYDLQMAAVNAGRKYIFLVIFDGMDWQTTRAAAIYNTRSVSYRQGRGTGNHFQDYAAGGTTQFGYMVTAPHNGGTEVDLNRQRVQNPGGRRGGGYNAAKGGETPWDPGTDPYYIMGRGTTGEGEHPYADSASTATSMTTGAKTYNAAINVAPDGSPLTPIAYVVQERGWAVGAVSSVPISHATPAAAYARNVHRNDYQDLSRDMLGLPSVFHPQALEGMDVVIGGGFGVERQTDPTQGDNYVPGNAYLTYDDLYAVNRKNGGKYIVAVRTAGVNGSRALAEAAREAASGGHRLLGFYGLGQYGGHLPYQTASGTYNPAPGRARQAESYARADLQENPTLAEMTEAALTVLSRNPNGFWIMVEPGDVDWANHDNNLDTSIGALNSGDEAVKVITDWVEKNSSWDESVLIVTADHGHYFVLNQPELLIPPPADH